MRRSNWITVPISQLYDGLYDGPHATPKPADEGPVFLGIKNVTEDGHLDLSEVRHIAEDDFAAWTRRVAPRPGDLVFTYEATLNRYAIIPEGFRGCLGRRMALIRPNRERVDTRYLHFYFFSSAWRDVIRQNTLSGSTVDRIPLTHFPTFPVHVPPLAEQRRIAGILSAYDDLIENCEQRIRVLDEMTHALYREWFVLFRYPGHEKTPLVESTLGRIPKGWRAEPLQSGAGTIQDGDWIETKDQGGDDYRLLQISNVGKGNFVETGNYRYVTAQTFSHLRCTEVMPGDILVARMPTPIGRAWLVTPQPWRMITAVDVAIVRTDPARLLPSYLVRAWNDDSNLRRIAAQASGTTRPRVTRRELAALAFVVPPLALQREFDSLQAAWAALSDNLRVRSTKLRDTRDLLLPRLLSGQLSVDEAA